ncbi:HEPN domain-containing protein, partial [Candidatus Micrarchaeota archaeon]|nr:HEPN domain-containing protein [Candidatus Micrarchaeota archaeon]
IFSACKKLNPHYIQTRYPDAANAIPKDAYDEEIAEELIEKAKEVFEWSKKQTEK